MTSDSSRPPSRRRPCPLGGLDPERLFQGVFIVGLRIKFSPSSTTEFVAGSILILDSVSEPLDENKDVHYSLLQKPSGKGFSQIRNLSPIPG